MVVSGMAGPALGGRTRRDLLRAIGAVSSVSFVGCTTDRGVLRSVAPGIEAWLRQIVDNGWVAGAAVAVTGAGGGSLTRSFGHADREAAAPIKPDTIYRIYSMTKPITAAAMMAVIEDGAARLDQPIADFVPEFAAPRVFVRFEGEHAITEPARRPITIRHLLTHTSGLSESFNRGLEPTAEIYHRIGLRAGNWDPALGIRTLADFSARLAEIPLAFHPGERWLYSSSLDLAGRVVEVASGRDFAAFTHDRMLAPLRMNDTAYAIGAEQTQRLAAMYFATPDQGTQRTPDAQIPAWNAPGGGVVPMGGGGLFSTLPDYVRFTRMLLNKGELEGVRALSRGSVEQMMTSHLPPELGDTPLSEAARFGLGGEVAGLGFGFGGSVLLDPARAGGIGHVGEYAWGGAASTTFWVDPVENFSVVLMTQKLPSGVHPLRDQLRRIVYQPSY